MEGSNRSNLKGGNVKDLNKLNPEELKVIRKLLKPIGYKEGEELHFARVFKDKDDNIKIIKEVIYENDL